MAEMEYLPATSLHGLSEARLAGVQAEVEKLADSSALGADARKSMRVQLPPSAQATYSRGFFSLGGGGL